MILKEHGHYAVYCDICGEKLGNYDTFDEAKEAIKANGWKTAWDQSGTSNYCPDCMD